MKILLISGHGAGDPGAVSTISGVTYKEREMTRDVTAKIAAALAEYEVDVTIYPTDKNAYTDYKSGNLNKTAQFETCDYCLEVHFNAGASDLSGNGSTTGTEIFFPSAGSKSGAEEAVLDAIASYGLKKRRTASGQYAVINTAARAGCAANLLEVCFIDDADDMAIYNKKSDELCASIAKAVAQWLGLEESMTEDRVREIVTEMLRGENTTVSSALKYEWDEAQSLGITDGTRPNGYATRAQVGAMIVRATKL